ncbi:MAG TPA: hypothetical protein VIG64_03540 [Actinomycetota bacterium]|jgi:hypothetical protein
MRTRIIVALTIVVSVLPASPVAATLPGGNGRILNEVCYGGAQRCYVRVRNLDAGSGVILTSGEYVRDTALAWSPDGRRILYSRKTFRNGIEFKGLFTIDQNGDNRRKLTERIDGAAAYSPDGDRIAVANRRGIWIMRRDGSRIHRIYDARNDPRPLAPGITWMASGRIAFLSYRNFRSCSSRMKPDVWTIKPDGTGLDRVTRNGFFESNLDSSPNGNRIMYLSLRPCSPVQSRLFSIRVDGTGERRMAHNPKDEPAVYSPDGDYLLQDMRPPEILNTRGEKVRMAAAFGLWQPVLGTKPGTVAMELRRKRSNSERIVIKGRIATKVRGVRIRAILYRHRGGEWEHRYVATAGTGRRGQFDAILEERPPTGRCRLVVHVPRTTEHRRVKETRRFPCDRPR